jgi:hypothetical protein
MLKIPVTLKMRNTSIIGMRPHRAKYRIVKRYLYKHEQALLLRSGVPHGEIKKEVRMRIIVLIWRRGVA